MSAKKIGKQEKHEEKTEHLHEWRHIARNSGWSRDEIDAFDGVLTASKSEDRVVWVESHRIYVFSLSTLKVGGISRDGMYVENSIPHHHRWIWQRYDKPVPGIASAERGAPWCPAHGTMCSPTKLGCGRPKGTIGFDICTCGDSLIVRRRDGTTRPIQHHPSCEVVRIEAEIRDSLLREAAEEPIDEFQPVRHGLIANPSSKRNRGNVLPGQMAFPDLRSGKNSE